MDDRFARLRLRGLVLWPLAALALLVAAELIPPHADAGVVFVRVAYVFYAALMLAGVRACRAAGIGPSEIVGPVPRAAGAWLRASALVVVLHIFGAFSLMLVASLIGAVWPEWMAERATGQSEALFRFGGTSRILLVAIVVIFAPIVEEFVFRGILLRKWASSIGIGRGLLASAAVFAALHPPFFVPFFATGTVLGVLYLWSRSLFLPLVVHMLMNAVVVLLILSESGSRATGGPLQLIDGPGEWVFMIAALLVVTAILIALVYPLLGQLRQRAVGPGGEGNT